MDDRYYAEKEIKIMFESYEREPMPIMNGGEYELFCCGLKPLPKEIMDEVYNKACFVNLRDKNPEYLVTPACHISLEDEIA